jgi:hypothetical protein
MADDVTGNSLSVTAGSDTENNPQASTRTPDPGAAQRETTSNLDATPESAAPVEQEAAAETQAPTQKDDLSAALSRNTTPEQAEAAGDYTLAAQLRAQQQFSREALEENDAGSTDVSDGEMSYSASVARGQGGYYKSAYANYFRDDWIVDDDGFDKNGYDDYGFYTRTYEEPQQQQQPKVYLSNSSQFAGAPAGVLAKSADFMSSFLGGITDIVHSIADVLSPSNAPAPTTTASNFFDFSSPVRSTGQPVANTAFFDPTALQALTLANDNTNAAPAAIAPTNPHYKPSGKTGLTL